MGISKKEDNINSPYYAGSGTSQAGYVSQSVTVGQERSGNCKFIAPHSMVIAVQTDDSDTLGTDYKKADLSDTGGETIISGRGYHDNVNNVNGLDIHMFVTPVSPGETITYNAVADNDSGDSTISVIMQMFGSDCKRLTNSSGLTVDCETWDDTDIDTLTASDFGTGDNDRSGDVGDLFDATDGSLIGASNITSPNGDHVAIMCEIEITDTSGFDCYWLCDMAGFSDGSAGQFNGIWNYDTSSWDTLGTPGGSAGGWKYGIKFIEPSNSSDYIQNNKIYLGIGWDAEGNNDTCTLYEVILIGGHYYPQD